MLPVMNEEDLARRLREILKDLDELLDIYKKLPGEVDSEEKLKLLKRILEHILQRLRELLRLLRTGTPYSLWVVAFVLLLIGMLTFYLRYGVPESFKRFYQKAKRVIKQIREKNNAQIKENENKKVSDTEIDKEN